MPGKHANLRSFGLETTDSYLKQGSSIMESEAAVRRVEELLEFDFKDVVVPSDEIAFEFRLLGLTFVDCESNGDLLFEVLIARNIRHACEALNIAISPHQALTLATHTLVGQKNYRNGVGVPLSDRERDIALRLVTIRIRGICRKNGHTFDEALERECETIVRFGERGLTVGHKIGEATGCFQVLLFVTFSTVSSITLFLIVLQ